MSIGSLDLAVLIAYVACVLGVGFATRRRTGGASDYLLGARDLPWWALLLSIVATETSAVTVLSTPGLAFGGGLKGSTGDLRFLQVPLGYVVGRLVVVAWLLPLYCRGQVMTAYEVLAHRFGGGVRKLASVIFLVTRTLGDGLRLYLTALVLKLLLPIDLTTAVAIMGTVALVYTWAGGMRAVVWTDVLQFGVYMAGAFAAFAVLLAALPGGTGDVIAALGERGRVFDFSFDLTSKYTFWTGLIGGAVLSLGSHGVDQMIVQRYLAARSQQQAALALLLSGVVVLLQFAFFLVLGVGLAVFYAASPPATPFATGDDVFVDFIVHHTPDGVRGLVVGAVFAAALSGSLNSCASSLVNDVVLPLRGLPPDHPSALRLAKGATLLFGGLQIAVGASGLGLHGRTVIEQVLGIAALTLGLLLGLFALGTLTSRVREGHALIGLVAGVAVDLALKFGVPGLLAPSPLDGLWYGAVGAGTVFVAGVAASVLSSPRR
ncbi:MAG TPA: transporter [Planctomycetota bacterium]|nr:transporter [Planctomycetota bacterium]